MSIYRTTLQTSNSYLLSNLRQTQYQMQKANEQISTLKKVNRISDAPATASAILLLQRQIETRGQTDRNLQHASNVLNNIDSSLNEVTNILLDAGSIASEQIGIGSTADTRKNQADIIDAQLTAMLDIANRQIQGISLFGGNGQPTADHQAFVSFLGGIQYIGSTTNLNTDVGSSSSLAFNSNGGESFGALSSRVSSQADLNPLATTATRVADVNGGQNAGVRSGSITLQVNATTVTVDLSSVDTLGDVTTRINAAINNIDPAAGSLSVGGNGFSLTANAGNTIAISALGTSQAAADLGLVISATGTTTAGADVNPKLTAQTTLASLGATIDFAGGLKITQGTTTKIADFSSATSIQDMIHIVDQLNLGVKLQINADGSALDLTSNVSGVAWSVGENAGGTTASDLGVRTFGTDTVLTDFNHGLGVHTAEGEPDFEIQLHDGSTFQVNLDGVHDVNDLINAISTAAAAAGLTVGTPGSAGTDFNVGLASDGNGLSFEDGTAGASDFKVVNLGLSLAATDLGIYTNAGAASSITGDDVAKARVESVFTHLMDLRDALLNNDSRGITFAADALQDDVSFVIQARADVAVRAQRAESMLTRSADEGLAEQSALSFLVDADVTEAITRFTALQTQLQASLQVGAQISQLTLMDFIG